jgi:hypothetical protein
VFILFLTNVGLSGRGWRMRKSTVILILMFFVVAKV